MNSSRLFFALWPDGDTRARLAQAAAGLPERGGKRVPERNLHLTLVFLGEVEEIVRDGLIEDADRLPKPPPFTLEMTHSGWWPRARVAWLAPDAVPAELGPLVAALENSARARGVMLDARPYAPHLTIARKVRRRPPPLRFPPVRWEIRDFCLVRSAAEENGSVYTILRRWPLTAP